MPTKRPRMNERPQTGFRRGQLHDRGHDHAHDRTAVNIEMAMPSPMVTAKPRIAPEPNGNSSTVAIRAVMLELTGRCQKRQTNPQSKR